MCRSRFAPIGLPWTPFIAQSFHVSVAILADDGSDALRMGQREAQSGRGAVVENVERIALEADAFPEVADHLGEAVERVIEASARRRLRLAETREIGRDEMEMGFKQRDEVPE